MAVFLLTLIHLLVLVYWLGGDLGAFYGSNFMVDPKRGVAERMMALKILNNVDMAPRTALILAFPTGLALAWAKAWIDIPGGIVAVVVAAFLAWLALAWTVHLQHGTREGVKQADMSIRYIVLAGLAGAGIAGASGFVDMPFFIALKMIILALCICLGLVVRHQLVPLFGAIREMNSTGPTPATDAVIAGVNARARRSVIAIWILILFAGYLGIATPT